MREGIPAMSAMDDPRVELARLTAAVCAELELLAAAGPATLLCPPGAEPAAPPHPVTPAQPAEGGDASPVHQAPASHTKGVVSAPSGAAELAAFCAELQDCTQCGLCRARTRVVFGEGAADARLMFIGEGPGADEDRTGRPFVGKAGQLLTRMIAAMGLEREQVYIANVVKCRPPGNRAPTLEETQACTPFLRRQIELVRPALIVALGGTAARCLLGGPGSVGRLRGSYHAFHDTPVLVTYHPAYLLRSPGEKKIVWQDLQEAMRFLGLSMPKRA
jgi:DNA polymerase